MNITEIRVKMVGNEAERLKAFCSITLDSDFVIRDLKVIDGTDGLFVAMPSRKLSDRCSKCGYKNHLRARFCNDCGAKLNDSRGDRDGQGRAKLHADVAHPINATCRERLQKAVIEAFQLELNESKQPGYTPTRYDDDLNGNDKRQEAPKQEHAPRHQDAPKQERAPMHEDPPKHQQESFEEPEDPSANQADDFNALIAGLKQDAAKRRDQRTPRQSEQRDHRRSAPPSSKPAQPQPSERSPREKATVDDFLAGLQDPAETDQPTDSAPAKQEPKQPEPESAPVAASAPERDAPPAPASDESDDDGFGAGIL